MIIDLVNNNKYLQLLLFVIVNISLCVPIWKSAMANLAMNIVSTSGELNLLIVAFDGFRPDFLTQKLTPYLYSISQEGN